MVRFWLKKKHYVQKEKKKTKYQDEKINKWVKKKTKTESMINKTKIKKLNNKIRKAELWTFLIIILMIIVSTSLSLSTSYSPSYLLFPTLLPFTLFPDPSVITYHCLFTLLPYFCISLSLEFQNISGYFLFSLHFFFHPISHLVLPLQAFLLQRKLTTYYDINAASYSVIYINLRLVCPQWTGFSLSCNENWRTLYSIWKSYILKQFHRCT